jgi:hypothetical protein
MTDEELLELVERVRTKLRQVVSNATHWASARDDYVLTINNELQRLLDAGLNVGEWVIPESELLPSHGYHEPTPGHRVQVRRMNYERFLEYVSPMLDSLDREVVRRRNALAKDKPVQPSTPADPAEVWVIHGRDSAFRMTIYDLLRRVRLHPIEFNEAVARSGSGSPNVLDLILREIHTAPAIVSLLSPDDYAKLRPELRSEPKGAKKNIQAGY